MDEKRLPNEEKKDQVDPFFTIRFLFLPSFFLLNNVGDWVYFRVPNFQKK